jgi:hypothetical protein
MSVRHSQVLLGFSGVFCLRAMAELGTGDTAAALRDAATIDRMQAALRLEPLLISHLVRLTVLAYLAPILEQGAAQHRWNDDQLRTLQEIFGRIDLLADHERTLRGERALLNDYFERLRQTRTNLATTLLSFGIQDSRPKPNLGLLNALPQNILFYHNQAWHNRWIQELVLPVIDPSAERIYPRRQAAAEEIERQTRTTPYNFLAKLTLPIYPSMALRTAAMHVLVREAQVACALERFRLKNGQYPKSLAELVPDYLASPVQDTFSSEPLRYRLDGKDTFILYSIGWNEVDDGGVIALKPGSINRRDDQAGDWVWFGGAR